ncbi:MAG: hypothetical protein M3Y41_22080 [Pseudomonadota bacterium]|nr:hypothetical protein [Pseudomonadota bacterium]
MLRPGRLTQSYSLRFAVLLALVVPASLAEAGECGLPAPDYTAERAVTVGDSTVRMTVHVSADKEREDARLEGHLRVTIRDARTRQVVVFDPETQRAVAFMPPASQGARPTARMLDEAGPDGTHVRVVQFKRGGTWLDLSRTRCRADGIMIGKNFVSLDPLGREVQGTVTQDRISVGVQSPGLFELPPGVRVARP